MTLYDAVSFALIFALTGTMIAVCVTAITIMAHEWWSGKR